MKTVIHLICNAHLDPVWFWEWEEGAAEAISTFRTAAEMCQNHNTFIFNHNEAILYKWVYEYDPDLFKTIQQLVKRGRWHIMGGWYLQPDCNMSSGESLVRQILLGREFFKQYFNAEPTTAINFDPFGHSRGLVQIMAKSGYDSYLFGRPQKEWLDLPEEDFMWVGFDGSKVLARRFSGWYSTRLGQAKEQIEERISVSQSGHPVAILWGVGNHGGGPSKQDLINIDKLIKERSDLTIEHSTPETYFKQISGRQKSLPEYDDDLNPWGVGCYSSQVRVKQKHRLLENEYLLVEKMATAAWAQSLLNYPVDELKQACCDLLTAEFHDILPGSSIQPVEEMALRLIDHGLEILSRVKARTFFALARNQQKPNRGDIPVFVYNPHPYSITRVVECEFNLADFNEKGTFTLFRVKSGKKLISSQVEKEMSNMPVDWRKRLVIRTNLKPGMNRFDCTPYEIIHKANPQLRVSAHKIVFKTSSLEAVVNTETGLIDKYRVNGRDLIGPGAFELLVLADNEDPWQMRTLSFRKVVGRFKLMTKNAGSEFSGLPNCNLESVRIIEDGAVRSVIEAVFKYHDSFICQRYKLSKTETEIEIEIKVYWNEKDKMLKLCIPVASDLDTYWGQVPYGREKFASNGNEMVAQKWVAAVSKNNLFAVTCINDGTYSSDFSEKGLRLTLLRSPAYSAHPIDKQITLPQDRFTSRIDQGERTFKFWVNGGSARERLGSVDSEALVHNEKPFALSFFSSGSMSASKPFIQISNKRIQMTALKKAQKDDSIIVRLFESQGISQSAVLHFGGIKYAFKIKPFEIKTLKIKNGKTIEVNLLEY